MCSLTIFTAATWQDDTRWSWDFLIFVFQSSNKVPNLAKRRLRVGMSCPMSINKVVHLYLAQWTRHPVGLGIIEESRTQYWSLRVECSLSYNSASDVPGNVNRDTRGVWLAKFLFMDVSASKFETGTRKMWRHLVVHGQQAAAPGSKSSRHTTPGSCRFLAPRLGSQSSMSRQIRYKRQFD